jgi:hypothetical protein
MITLGARVCTSAVCEANENSALNSRRSRGEADVDIRAPSLANNFVPLLT